VACPSGLRSTPRKRVTGNPRPRVQIPPPPPRFIRLRCWSAAYGEPFRRSLGAVWAHFGHTCCRAPALPRPDRCRTDRRRRAASPRDRSAPASAPAPALNCRRAGRGLGPRRKTIGRLRNRRGLDGGAVERWPTKDVLTEIVAEVWHSDQQHKATKERRKRVGKAQKHQSES
jgi:hypothetical protein